ncbi:MAG: 3-hydroxyacyl-ACP dehydratase [Thermodesulfobacteriota bacterium]
MAAASPRLPLPAAGIIPHAAPMLLVDEVLALRDGGGVVRACPAPDWPLAGPDGEVAAEAGVEMAAQAYAAVRGAALAPGAPSPSLGYLVGVQDFRIVGRVRVGDDLRVEVSTVGEFAGFAVVEAVLRRGPDELARGRLKVWTPEAGA